MGFIQEPDPKKFMLDKIKSSGLTAIDAKQLNLHACVNSPTEPSSIFRGIPLGAGFAIPYYTTAGKRLSTFRFRYALPKIDHNGRLMRYSQPTGTPPAVYLPRLDGVNWEVIASSPRVDLLITEGELKSACATKLGHPCIGLGGVWNFQSKNLDFDFLPQLDEFTWDGRNVYIVYDSDSVYNQQVQKAMNMLARLLEAKRAVVHIATPPAKDVGGKQEKVGLDDYVVDQATGIADADKLHDLLQGADKWQETSEVYKLNAEVAYIQTPSMVVVLPQPHFPKAWRTKAELIGVNVFIKQRFYERTYMVLNENGKLVQRRTAEVWFGDTRRRTHHSIVYMPGHPSVIDNQFNMWQGWPHTPVPGNVAPFLDLLGHMFDKEQTAECEWFLNWLAYPIKHPGTKLNTACLLWGLQGTGKSTIGVTMQAIYGEHNCSVPGQGELERDFNSWLADKQFIIAEEVTGNDGRKYVSKLKHLVTGHTIHINKKGIEPFDYPNRANFLFTSNYSNALYIDEDDRRYFVHELKGKLTSAWWNRYSKWLYQENGAAHLHHWFLQRDTADFSPTAPALVTRSHHEVVQASMSELDLWMFELREDPNSKMRRGDVVLPYRFMSTEEVYDLYVGADSYKKITRNTVGRALARAGFKQANRGNWIELTPKGTRRAVWAIRNPQDATMLQGKCQTIYQEERQQFNSTHGRKF